MIIFNHLTAYHDFPITCSLTDIYKSPSKRRHGGGIMAARPHWREGERQHGHGQVSWGGGGEVSAAPTAVETVGNGSQRCLVSGSSFSMAAGEGVACLKAELDKTMDWQPQALEVYQAKPRY